ncbi:PH, RCC1 and FYVE domains-containing protein 1-like isoform X2 [Telopea speciosissima]|uniref:PH, RCC1 and FYVE domains-containing protein 1-like isoform X2 n=1 Tax=Telopea speciosissima TaxID=54955 RepID=UPI001CC634D8|nr:PH, RCC1 and FYVE domains-containing protein 1-like isoform X2 [Telopea speciosissima]
MADSQCGLAKRDVEQAITSLKKGTYLLKYGRRGKPKFCPFRLANDESLLIWYSGKEERQLKLNHVSRIIPGQRTAIFQRYPQPDKEYQSFSLIYSDRSLDLICKDKDEAEVWFVGLKALITRGSPNFDTQGYSPLGPCEINDIFHKDPGDTQRILVPSESFSQIGLGKAFSDVMTYTASVEGPSLAESVANNSLSSFSSCADNSNGRSSTVDNVRVSSSSAVSSSSQGSGREDFDSLGDVFLWGEGLGDGVLGGGTQRVGSSSATKMDALFPKALESSVVLGVHNIACGGRHAVLVTKQGEIFSWGEESGGRLGHGVEADVSQPRLINTLSGLNIELVACGDYHTCAVTLSGDLYMWGDGTYGSGLLGDESEASHWIPKKLSGQMEGIHVSFVSCGPWHTAAVTSSGQLFTFGDGTFGALGHGDRSSTCMPREVETLKGLRTMRVACGVWHTAAIVEVVDESSGSGNSSSGKLFTWGDGDKGRLGHGGDETRLVPGCVAPLVDESFFQVACGHDITVGLTASGQVYTMGSTVYGQLGNPDADGKLPTCIEGKISNCFVEEVACGSHHVAVLTSKLEVYTWGKGANGRLGHGDNDDRNTPTLIEALKDKQVKSVVCGSSFTAVICLHKWVSNDDNSICSGCHNQFGFRRKRHNCYNCGLVFCKACSTRKSLKASLAPNMNKPYRVCDDCFFKLKKVVETGSMSRLSKIQSGNILHSSSEVVEKETFDYRLHGQLTRLSSVDSCKQAEARQSKRNRKSEPSNSRFSSLMNGSSQWGSSFVSKSSTSLFGSPKKMFFASVPGSRVASRATSPILGKPSPPRSATPTPTLTDMKSPEVTVDDPKHTNDSIGQDIIKLRAQVEELTGKSQLLEAELERTSRKLMDASAIAGDENAKCKAAKEVIKSLVAQLKDMAERVSEGSTARIRSGSTAMQTASIPSPIINESRLSSLNSPELESNGLSVDPLSCNGTKTQTDPAEWVVQDEPGVYITVSSLPGGGRELKRARFSRKRFSEKQAEKWWTENKAKVYQRHNIRSKGKSRAGPPSVSPEEKHGNKVG